MKKTVFIPLMATGVLLGCQEANQSQAKDASAIEQKMQKPLWAGSYSGTTPCMSCASRCEDCPGMAVDLVLNQDQTYELRRESLSGHNAVMRDEIISALFCDNYLATHISNDAKLFHFNSY